VLQSDRVLPSNSEGRPTGESGHVWPTGSGGIGSAEGAQRPNRMRSRNSLTWHATIILLFVVLVAGGVGLPLPEDLTLLGAGALAQPGLVRLTDVVLAGFAGVVTADWILYGIGRYYGAEIIGHPRLARQLGAQRIDAVRGAVMRHQARAVFLARFVLGTRIITFLAAGTFGVSAVRFALAEAAGSIIFVPATVTFGYLFADRALRIAHGAGRVEHWLVLGGLIGLALYLLALRAWAPRTPLDDGGLPGSAAPPRDAAPQFEDPPPSPRPPR
jgi:membrane protein DedA with SNARE-associated domain